MTSVRIVGPGSDLFDATIPTMTGNWIMGCWIRSAVSNYVTKKNIFGIDNGVQIVGAGVTDAIDVNALSVYVYDGGTLDGKVILGGQSTAWIYVAIQHVAGSANYLARWRLENVYTWSSFTMNTGVQLTTPNAISIGANAFGDDVLDAGVRSFFCKTAVMSDANLLIASQSLNVAPAGANLHWLLLNNSVTAGTNGGTGGSWTVEGTLQTVATEPTETPPGYVPPIMVMGSGF